MAQQITLSAKALVAAAKAQIKEYMAEEAIQLASGPTLCWWICVIHAS